MLSSPTLEFSPIKNCICWNLRYEGQLSYPGLRASWPWKLSLETPCSSSHQLEQNHAIGSALQCSPPSLPVSVFYSSIFLCPLLIHNYHKPELFFFVIFCPYCNLAGCILMKQYAIGGINVNVKEKLGCISSEIGIIPAEPQLWGS